MLQKLNHKESSGRDSITSKVLLESLYSLSQTFSMWFFFRNTFFQCYKIYFIFIFRFWSSLKMNSQTSKCVPWKSKQHSRMPIRLSEKTLHHGISSPISAYYTRKLRSKEICVLRFWIYSKPMTRFSIIVFLDKLKKAVPHWNCTLNIVHT